MCACFPERVLVAVCMFCSKKMNEWCVNQGIQFTLWGGEVALDLKAFSTDSWWTLEFLPENLNVLV